MWWQQDGSARATAAFRFHLAPLARGGLLLEAECRLAGLAALGAARRVGWGSLPLGGGVELAAATAARVRVVARVRLCPWRLRAKAEALVVEATGARLTVRPSVMFCECPAGGLDAARAATLAAFDAMLIYPSTQGPVHVQRRKATLAAHALRPLRLTLDECALLYIHEVSDELKGRTPFTEAQIELAADTVSIRDAGDGASCDAAASGLCAKRFSFEGVRLASRLGTAASRGSPFGVEERILHRWKGSVDARFAGPSTRRRRRGPPLPPLVSIAASLQAASVTLSSTRVPLLMGVANYYGASDFAVMAKALRPARTVLERPAEWWRWAGGLVVRAAREEAAQVLLEGRLVRLLGRREDGSWGRSSSLARGAAVLLASLIGGHRERAERDCGDQSAAHAASDLPPLADQEAYMAEYLRQLDAGKLGWDATSWKGPEHTLEEVIALRCVALDRRRRAKGLFAVTSRGRVPGAGGAAPGNDAASSFASAVAEGRAARALRASDAYRDVEEAAGAIAHVVVECARVDVHLFTNMQKIATWGASPQDDNALPRPLEGETAALVFTLGGLGLRWELARMTASRGAASVGFVRVERRCVTQASRGGAAVLNGAPTVLLEAGDSACMHQSVRSAVALFKRGSEVEDGWRSHSRRLVSMTSSMAPSVASESTLGTSSERFAFVAMRVDRQSLALTIELAPIVGRLTPTAFGQVGELVSAASLCEQAIAPPFSPPAGMSLRELLATLREGAGHGRTPSRLGSSLRDSGGDSVHRSKSSRRPDDLGQSTYRSFSNDNVNAAFPNLVARLRPGDPDRHLTRDPLFPETAIDVQIGGLEVIVEDILEAETYSRRAATPAPATSPAPARTTTTAPSPTVHVRFSACALRGGRGLEARRLLCAADGPLHAAQSFATENGGLILLPAFEDFPTVTLPAMDNESEGINSADEPWEVFRVRAGLAVALRMPATVLTSEAVPAAAGSPRSPRATTNGRGARHARRASWGPGVMATPPEQLRGPLRVAAADAEVDVPVLLPCVIDAGFAENSTALALRPGQHRVISRVAVVRVPAVEVHLRPSTLAGVLLLAQPFKEAAEQAVARVRAAAAAGRRVSFSSARGALHASTPVAAPMAQSLPSSVCFELKSANVSVLESKDDGLALISLLSQDIAARATTASDASAIEADVQIGALALVDEAAARRSAWADSRAAEDAADTAGHDFLAGPVQQVGFDVPPECVLIGSDRGFLRRGVEPGVARITRKGLYSSASARGGTPLVAAAVWRGRSGDRAPYRGTVQIAPVRATFSAAVVARTLTEYCCDAALLGVLDTLGSASPAGVTRGLDGDAPAAAAEGSGAHIELDASDGAYVQSLIIELGEAHLTLLDFDDSPLAKVAFALSCGVSQKSPEDVSARLQLTGFVAEDYLSAVTRPITNGGAEDATTRLRPPPGSLLLQSDGAPGQCSIELDAAWGVGGPSVEVSSECSDFCFVMHTALISNLARDAEVVTSALRPLDGLSAVRGASDAPSRGAPDNAAAPPLSALARLYFKHLSVRLLDAPCMLADGSLVPAPLGAEAILTFHDFCIDVDTAGNINPTYPEAVVAAQASLLTLGHARSRVDASASIWDARFAAISIKAMENPTVGFTLPNKVEIDVPAVEADIAEWQFYQLIALIYWHLFGSPAPRERAGAAAMPAEQRVPAKGKVAPSETKSPSASTSRTPSTVADEPSEGDGAAPDDGPGDAPPVAAPMGANVVPAAVHVVLRLPLVRGLIVGQMQDSAIDGAPLLDTLVAPPQYAFRFDGAHLSIKVYPFSQIKDGCNFLELELTTRRLVLLDDTMILRPSSGGVAGPIKQTPLVRSESPAYSPTYVGAAAFPRRVTDAWSRPAVHDSFDLLDRHEPTAVFVFEPPLLDRPGGGNAAGSGARFTYVLTGKRMNAVMHLDVRRLLSYWPYFLDAPPLWMLSGTFSSYVMGEPREAPTVPPSPRPWSYFNFSADQVRMFWPTLVGGRDDLLYNAQPSAKADEGIVVSGAALGINYSYGGFGECVFKVIARDVTASVRQRGSRMRLLKPTAVVFQQQFVTKHMGESKPAPAPMVQVYSSPASPAGSPAIPGSPVSPRGIDSSEFATARADYVDSDEGEDAAQMDAPSSQVRVERQLTQVDTLVIDDVNIVIPLSAIRVLRSVFDLVQRVIAGQDLPGYGYSLARNAPAPCPPPTRDALALQAATSVNYTMTMDIDGMSATLLHDGARQQVQIARATASELHSERMRYIDPGATPTADSETRATVSLELYNSTREALEAVVEPWNCMLSHSVRGYSSKTLRSDQRLGVVISPEHLPSLDAIPVFKSAWMTPLMPSPVRPARAEAVPPTIVNRTGTDLYFWMICDSAAPEDGESEEETGGAWREGIRAAREGGGSGSRETLARVLARDAAHSLPFPNGTLHIQLDGGWRPFPPIGLHPGAQAWAVSCESLVSTARPLVATLVAEVTVRPDGLRVVELHSTLRLRNNTSAGLAAHLRLRDATSAATMTGEVEHTIELAADGGAHWVPITFLTGRGMLELKTEGHQWAADHVELSPTTAGLLSAQRVIVFDPEPVRCGDSMSVMDDIEAEARPMICSLHVSGADSAIASDPTDDPRSSRVVVSHALILSAPIVVHNRLPRPYSIDVSLRQAAAPDAAAQRSRGLRETMRRVTKQPMDWKATLQEAVSPEGSGGISVTASPRGGRGGTGQGRGSLSDDAGRHWRSGGSESLRSVVHEAVTADGFRRLEVGQGQDMYDFDVSAGAVNIVVKLRANGVEFAGSCRGPVLGPTLSKDERERFAARGQKVTLLAADGSTRRLHIFVRVHRRAAGETAQHASSAPAASLLGQSSAGSVGCLGAPISVDSPGSTWDIELYAPYWVMNMTGLPLEIRDAGRHRRLVVGRGGMLGLEQNASQVQLKPIDQADTRQWESRWKYEGREPAGASTRDSAQRSNSGSGRPGPGSASRQRAAPAPALFWATRGKVQLRSTDSDWSARIDIDKAGTSGVVRLICRRSRSSETEYLSTSDTVRRMGIRRRCMGRQVGARSGWSETYKVYEIAVSVQLATQAHADSRIVLLSPYIIVSNRSEMRLAFGQMGYVDVAAASFEAERQALEAERGEETPTRRHSTARTEALLQEERKRVYMRSTDTLATLNTLHPDCVTQFHWQPTVFVDSSEGGWPDADPARRSLQMTVRVVPSDEDAPSVTSRLASMRSVTSSAEGDDPSRGINWVVEEADGEAEGGGGASAGGSDGWRSTSRRRRQVRQWVEVSKSPWEWSSPFRIDEVGDFCLRLRHAETGERALLPVYVKAEGSSLVLVFGPPNGGPSPYAISNETRFACAYFAQKSTEDEYGWSVAPPLSKEPYSWDVPLRPHVLTLQLTSAWAQPAPGAPLGSPGLAARGGVSHALVTKDVDIDDISPQSHTMLILRNASEQLTAPPSRRWASRHISRRGMRGKDKGKHKVAKGSGSGSSDSNDMPGNAPSSEDSDSHAPLRELRTHSGEHRRSVSFDDRDSDVVAPVRRALSVAHTAASGIVEQSRETHDLARIASKARAADLWHTAAGVVVGGAAGVAHAADIFRKASMRHERTVFIRVVANGPTRELVISEVPVEDNRFRDEEVAMLRGRLGMVGKQLRDTNERMAELMALVQDRARFLAASSVGGADDKSKAATPAAARGAATGGARTPREPPPPVTPATAPRNRPTRVKSELVRVPDHVLQRQVSERVEDMLSPLRWESLANALAPSSRHEAAMIRSASSMLRRMHSTRSSRLFGAESCVPSGAEGEGGKLARAPSSASPTAQAARVAGNLSSLGGGPSSSAGSEELEDIAEDIRGEMAAARSSSTAAAGSSGATDANTASLPVSAGASFLPKPSAGGAPSSSPSNTTSAAATPHLGGELHVRVCSARGLGVELFAAGGGGLRRPPPPDRLNPYVSVELEAATAHTRKLRGTGHPRWDEVLTFSGVSARSVLKAQVWHGRDFGDDVFLGEVYINLETVPPPSDDGAVYTLRLMSEVQHSGRVSELYDPSGAILATPAQWMPLGRRGQSDHVSGELEVAVCWNVSPIDRIGLELRAREQELAVKNQLLVILEQAATVGGAKAAVAKQAAARAKRASAAPGELPLPVSRTREAAAAAVRIGREVLTTQSPATSASRDAAGCEGETDKSRTSKSVIRKVVVRVIEARNLHIAISAAAGGEGRSGVRASSCNTFVRLRMRGMAGSPAARTRVGERTFSPAWNETFEFDQVPSIAQLSVRLLNRGVLRGALLGKASLHLSQLEHGRAHFLWLRLMPPKSEHVGGDTPGSPAGGVGGGDLGHGMPRIGTSGHPEVRLRVQLVVTGQPTQYDLRPFAGDVRQHIAVALRGIGVSILDPRSGPVGGFGGRGSASASQAVAGGAADAEAEDLLHLYLGHVSAEWKAQADQEQAVLTIEDLQIDNMLRTASLPVMVTQTPRDPPRPVLEVSSNVQRHMSGVRHFAYFSILMQELDITVEEDFLDRWVGFTRKMPRIGVMEKLLLTAAATTDDPHDAMRMVETPARRAAAANPTVYSFKLYFDLLHLHPVRLNVSVVASSSSPAELATRRDRFSLATGLPVVTIKSAPMFLEAKVFEHVFISRSELLLRLSLHYRAKALQEIYKILGSAEFLGNPTNVLSSMGTGMASLFYDPFAAAVYNPNAEEFGLNVARGSKTLVLNTLYAVTTTVSALTGSLGSNVGRIAAPGGVAGGSLSEAAGRLRARSILNSRGRVKGVRNTFGFMGGAVAEGAGDLVSGVTQGLGGLVTDPIAGAGQRGVAGFVGGMATGTVGAFARPVSGFFSFVSKACGGAARAADDRRVITARVREPRVGERARRLEHGHMDFALRAIIFNAKRGRYRTDPVADFVAVAPPMAVAVTAQRALLVNTERGSVVWSVQLDNVVAVAPDFEEVVVVYAPHLAASREVESEGSGASELRRWAVGMANRFNSVSRWRRRIYCATSDTRDRLVAMLRRVMAERAEEPPSAAQPSR